MIQQIVPRVVVFAGKAAPNYSVAKEVIKMIVAVADTINNDPRVRNLLKGEPPPPLSPLLSLSSSPSPCFPCSDTGILDGPTSWPCGCRAPPARQPWNHEQRRAPYLHPIPALFADALPAPDFIWFGLVLSLSLSLFGLDWIGMEIFAGNLCGSVVFIPNYNVSIAELIIPASDVSQHISTAGFEASGTSNMKFCMNGCLLLGSRDGANLEIEREVGSENIFMFGSNAKEVKTLQTTREYR